MKKFIHFAIRAKNAWHTRKLLLLMKLTIFLLLFAAVQVMGLESYSQETKLTLNLKSVSLKEILASIEEKSEYYFLYSSKMIDVEREMDAINIKEKNIFFVLDEILKGTNIEYVVKGRQILLSGKHLQDNTVENNLQKKVISGKVTNSSGDPIPGVTIIVKGTAQGAVTDSEGNYSLSNIPGDATLVFSFVGMKSQEIAVLGKQKVDIVLEEESFNLDEVVAIGYGSIKKSDLTGSVASVNSNDLNAFPTNSAVQALQGRATGVQIQSDNGGEPGGNYNILIRGSSSINASSSPLYVIDGFPQGTLPPADDIESIEILKDASATAIYGSRGANGVVLITTKKGVLGDAKIRLNTSYSVQNEIKRYDLLNAQQFAEMINTVTGSNAFDSPSSLGVGTDWQDEIFQTGNIQNYNLSISGGADKVNYYLSGVYFDQKGVILNSDFKRYSLTSNININASESVKLGLNLLIGRSDQNRLSTQEGTTSSQGGGILSTALLFAPSEPIYNEDGSYTTHPLGTPLDNPVALALERPSQTLSDYMQASLSGEFDLFKDFKYKLIIGIGTNNRRAGNYVSSKLEYGKTVGGIANLNNSKSTNILAENYFTYSKNFGDIHSLTIMGGYSFQSFSSESSIASGSDFLTDAGTWWNLGGASIFQQPRSNLVESELSSFYGRINYSINDKYLLTANARYDGSSRFAKNNKWAFFPSGAFAWNIYKEGFLADSETISQLKFRASYGVTGNQAISPYESLARFRYVFAVVNGKIVNAVSPLSVANNDLTWESTAQADVGLDLGLFNNTLLINADYYSKKTSDLLFRVPLPQYSGYPDQLKNIGEIENKGFEFALEVKNIVKVIQWDSKFNLSLNRNKVLSLPEGNDILYRTAPGQFVGIQNSQIIREGEPLGSFYGYVYEGVQQSGDELLDGAEGVGGERFRDILDDGMLTNEDRTIIGDPNPDFYWGWNNHIAFKNFDLNIFIQGMQGNDMLNYTRMGLESTLGTYNSTTAMLDSWTPTNTDTDIPQMVTRSQRLSSRWVEDGSYIRLENVVLGYTFPKRVLDKMNLSSLRIYVSGQKLLTFTNYKGFDPEVSWSSGNRNIGIDYGSYPNTKNFTVGVNIGF